MAEGLAFQPPPGPWEQLWLRRGFELRQRDGLLEVNGVPGFLLLGDLQVLWELGSGLPVGGRCLEVGSFQGLSSIVLANALLAQLNLRARVICVDTWEGSPEHQALPLVQEGGLFPAFLAHVRAAGVESLVEVRRGRSVEVAREFPDASLEAIFIDGDHSEAGCRADLEAWWPKLVPRGRFLGHDAVPGGGVRRAVEAFCRARGLRHTVLAPPGAHYMWEVHRD